MLGIHGLAVVVDVDAQSRGGSCGAQLADHDRTRPAHFDDFHRRSEALESLGELCCVGPQISDGAGQVRHAKELGEVSEDLPTSFAPYPV